MYSMKMNSDNDCVIYICCEGRLTQMKKIYGQFIFNPFPVISALLYQPPSPTNQSKSFLVTIKFKVSGLLGRELQITDTRVQSLKITITLRLNKILSVVPGTGSTQIFKRQIADHIQFTCFFFFDIKPNILIHI